MTTPDTTADRRAAYLRLVHDEDVLNTFRNTADDTLVAFGAGLAVEAFEGRYTAARWQARAFYRIPEDACDLAAAAYLDVCAPTMAAAILSRPSEGSLVALRQWLRGHGLSLTEAPLR